METGCLNFFNIPKLGKQGPSDRAWALLWLALGTVCIFVLFSVDVHAQVSIPGSDQSDKLQAAGSLLRLVDKGIFVWGARIFAGLCIMGAGWNLKEMRFGAAVVCVIAAIILGTAPLWVKNVFNLGGGSSIFSMNHSRPEVILNV